MPELGDEIMILEGLGGSSSTASSVITRHDLLSAIADFPIHVREQLLSGLNEQEDRLDDVIRLSTVISGLGELGRVPRHHPHPRPRPMPYPVPYPAYVGPTYVEPLVTEVVSPTNEPLIRRIRDLEKKMAALHPKTVKLLSNGIEGLEASLLPSNRSLGAATKIVMQIGAVQQAALSPGSDQAKQVARNLSNKAAELDRLAKSRLEVAGQAIADYNKNKRTVDRLERVARAKSLSVVSAAISRTSDPQVIRQKDREIKEIRKLHDRSVGVGRRALQNMKTYALSSMLAKNASGQAMVTRAARLAVERGKPEEARVLTAAINKHAEIAKQLKATRKEQVELWTGQNKQSAYDRLAGRRDRFLKAIAALNARSEAGELSEEDKRALRDAHLKLFKTESAMLSLDRGRLIPSDIKPKPYTTAGITLSSVDPYDWSHPLPKFSVEVRPNDPSGAFLQDLEAIYESKFEAKNRPNDPSGTFLQEIGAIFEPRFSVQPKPFTVAGETLSAIFEPTFSLQSKPFSRAGISLQGVRYVPGEPTFPIGMRSLPEQGRWLSDACFSSAADLIDDTPSYPGLFGLECVAKTLKKSCKNVANEVESQAASIVNYAKSKFNLVCGTIGDAAIRQVAAAAANVAPTYTTANLALKYSSKVCGKASSAKKALSALGEFSAVKIPKAAEDEITRQASTLLAQAGLPPDVLDLAKSFMKGGGSLEDRLARGADAAKGIINQMSGPLAQLSASVSDLMVKSLGIDPSAAGNIAAAAGTGVGMIIAGPVGAAIGGFLSETIVGGLVDLFTTTPEEVDKRRLADDIKRVNAFARGNKLAPLDRHHWKTQSEYLKWYKLFREGKIVYTGNPKGEIKKSNLGSRKYRVVRNKVVDINAGPKVVKVDDKKLSKEYAEFRGRCIDPNSNCLLISSVQMSGRFMSILAEAEIKALAELKKAKKELAKAKVAADVLEKARQRLRQTPTTLLRAGRNELKWAERRARERELRQQAGTLFVRSSGTRVSQLNRLPAKKADIAASKKKQLSDKRRAIAAAIKEAKKAVGMGDIYDISQLMDRRNAAERRMLAVQQRLREIGPAATNRAINQAYLTKKRAQLARKKAGLSNFRLYHPMRYVSASMEALPGNFPQVYDPMALLTRDLGQLPALSRLHRMMGVRRRHRRALSGLPGGFPKLYNPMKYVSASFSDAPTDFPDHYESLSTIKNLEGMALAIPVLLG